MPCPRDAARVTMEFAPLRRYASPTTAFLLVVGVGLAAWRYTVDDAFIVSRYAFNIASGRGYGLNAGHASDGITGPLWLVPGIVASWLGLDVVAVAKCVGLLCAAVAAALVVRRANNAHASAWAGWCTCIVVACAPTLGVWGQAGLETGAASLAFTAAMLAATRTQGVELRVLGPCLIVLAWLRPESLVAAGVLAAWSASKLENSARYKLLAFGLAAVASVCLFRMAMFGSVMPLSFFAKPGEISAGLGYTLRALVVHSTLFGSVLVAFSTRRALAWVLVSHIVAVALAGGDWMPGYRLMATVLPLYAMLVVDGASVLWSRGRRVLGSALVVASLILPVLDVVVEVPLAREAGRARETVGREISQRLRAHSQRVALVDVGYLVATSGVFAIDLGGVTSEEVGRARGSYLDKRVSESWLQRQAPDTIVLHSMVAPEVDDDGRVTRLRGYGVEQRVAHMRWVQDEFRVTRVFEYTPSYYYVVLSRARRN